MNYIDKYKIVKELGKGGFGKVYLVKDEKTAQLYALKLLNSVYNIERVKSHLEVLKILNTSDIFVKTYMSKRLAAQLMILMEYVEGENLEKFVKKEVFTESEASKVISDILDSLEFLHEHNLIHGDVKAENILKKNQRYILIDFDVVKKGKRVDTVHIQGDDEITAPEIYRGIQTPASDIYSLGCVLYFLLTAENIYGLEEKQDFSSIMFAHLYMPIKKTPLISEKMFYIISRMSDKNYETRADIEELRRLLQEKYVDKKHSLQTKIYRGISLNSKLQRYSYMANANVAYAQNILGLVYEEGIDVTKNNTSAFFWYKKAAEQGLTKAEFNLGLCYVYAKGCKKDNLKAFEYFSLASQKKHSRSLYHIAQMYEKGIEGTIDMKKAYMYYKQAALNGYKPAYKKIDLLARLF